MCHTHMILMLTTIQLSALMLNLSCAGNPKRFVTKKGFVSLFCLVALEVGGSAGPPGGTTAWNFRGHFQRTVLLSEIRYWTRTKVGPEVIPEVPALPVLPVPQAELPQESSGATSGGQFRLRFFDTGLGRKWHRNLLRYYRSPQRKYRPGGMNLFEDRW